MASLDRRLPLRLLMLGAALSVLAAACASEQIRAVREFNEGAKPVQIACLDVNKDGAVNAGDADRAALPDVTGDGAVTEAETSLVSQVEFTLPEGPVECDEGGGGPKPDWQVSEPPALDCAASERGVLLLAVGGGAVDLETLDNAAGARWMVEHLSSDVDVPAQIASVAPGLNATKDPQPDAERWAFAFLSQRLMEQPCLQVVILGHSHGGVLATATAARLEEAGLTDQILLTVLIDRATVLYAGDKESIPQSSPVFNVYLVPPEDPVRGTPLDQANVENFDAAGLEAPEHGEQGGALKPVNHTTIDNSEQVLEEVRARVLAALAGE